MTTDMLALLDRLETVHAAATPPPWRADLDRTGGYDLVDEDGQYITDRLGALDEDNAAAIVAEHNAIPGLVAAVRGALRWSDQLDQEAANLETFGLDLLSAQAAQKRDAAAGIRTALASALPDTTKD